MSSETALTGLGGEHTVEGTQIARLTQWQLGWKLANTAEWGDSDSEGWTNRAAGRKDATFTDEGKYDTESEVFDLFEPGDIATSVLLVTGSTLSFAFPRSLNQEFSLTVNVDTQEVIGWTGSWGTDGKPTFAT